MASSRTAVDVAYNEPSTDRRRRDWGKVQEIPFEELSNVRNQELQLARIPSRALSQDRDVDYDPRYNDQYALQRRTRDDDQYALQRTQRDDYNPQYARSSYGYDNDRGSRRRAVSAYDDDESDSSQDRRRRRRRERGDRSSKRDVKGKTDEGGHGDAEAARRKIEAEDEDDGRLWYSMKKRNEGSWVERNFDPSYDGLIAAAAGAALGAITVRRFDDSDDEKKGVKTLAAAVAGAAAFNAAENWYRVYTEEKEERKEKKEERQKQGRQQQNR